MKHTQDGWFSHSELLFTWRAVLHRDAEEGGCVANISAKVCKASFVPNLRRLNKTCGH